MGLFKKFQKRVSEPSNTASPQFLKEGRNGKYIFNLELFLKTMGESTTGLTNALVLLSHIVKEIGEGKELSDYDSIAVAYIMLANKYTQLSNMDGALNSLAHAGMLYDRFSPAQKSHVDNLLRGQEAAALIFEIYRLLGPSHPRPEQIANVIEFLKRTTREIEEKGKPYGSEGLLTYNNLNHDDVSRGYTQLAMLLRRWGEPQQAWETTIPNVCIFNFYSKLSKERRDNLHHIFSDLFPEAYSQLKEKMLDPMDEEIHNIHK